MNPQSPPRTPPRPSAGAFDKAWIRRLLPAALFQVCFLAAVTLLKPAANALVVARFNAEALPYLYVGSAALTAAVTALASLWGRRSNRDPLYLAVAGAVTALVVGAALHFGLSAGAFALYLFAESFTTFLAIVFWSSMGDAFDARESRRAFTALAGVGMSGSIVGGVLAQGLARHLGTLSLVVAGALMLLGAAWAFHFHRAPRDRAPPPPPRHGGPAPDAWTYFRSSTYPLALAGLVLALAVITPLADFVFRERAARSYAEDELAALFGNMQLWTGLLAAAFQLVLAERLLRWLGVMRYLGLIPLVLLPFALLAVLMPDPLWPAWALRLVESVISLSIVPVTVQLLYAPFPDALRDRARALMDGGVKKGGLALGGVLLIGAGPWLAESVPALVLVAVLGAVILAWLRLRPAYVVALQAQVGDAPAEIDPWIPQTQGLLVGALSAPEPDRALQALALLEQGGGEVRPHMARLLAHPAERVVEQAVRLSAKSGAVEVSASLEALLEAGARRPRAEAAWALARLAPERAKALLPQHTQSPDPGLRCSALGALATLGDDAAQNALRSLVARAEAAPVAVRRELARLYGRLANPEWESALASSLRDGDASVRNLAIRAVGEGRYAALAPTLLPFLTWREERACARTSLAALGDEVVPLLERTLNDRSRPGSLRYQLPRVLRQVGTQRALDVLLFSNVRDDAFLHHRIGVALYRLKETRPHLTADRQRVRDALSRRRDIYRRLAGAFRDVRAALGDEALLTRALGDRLDQAYELSFWLLGLLYPSRSLRRIHQHLCGEDPRKRAYALELFENLVEDEDREWVMEQTEGHHRALPTGAPGRLADHLGLLCHSDDHVLRACARQVARRHGLWTLPALEDDMSDAMVKRLFALEGVEIFTQSDVDDVAAVAQVAREHRFRAGERIYDEGDPGDALYVVLSGEVDAFRKGEKVLTLGDRQAFGEVSLLDGAPRPTRMVARRDTEVLIIDRRDFLDLIADRPELLKGIFRVVSRQLTDVVDMAASARRATGEVPRTDLPATNGGGEGDGT